VERTYTLADAVVSAIRITPAGVTRLVEFAITGGALS
jgi:hypothetical protein